MRYLRLVLPAAAPLQPWGDLTTSDASVVRCRSHPLADGAVDATCAAVSPGVATLSTTTAPFTGEPHGPPQDSWQLRIMVTDR